MRPLRRRVLIALLLVLPWAGGVRARGVATAARDLGRRLEARLRRAGIPPARYGVVVLTRSRPARVVFAAGSARPLVPASAAKLLTTATALDLLGPSHVFRTRVTARGVREAGVLHGDLILHGAGDPGISGRAWGGDALHVPRALARQVAAAGIHRVEGALVLDDGPLDLDFVHPDWSAADKRHWYGAPVGGLSFNDACVDVRVRGGRGAGPARVELPAGAGPWRVRNQVRTVPGARSAVSGRWEQAAGILDVVGRVAPGGHAGFPVPVPDPGLFLGGTLLRALHDAHVVVAHGMRRARDPTDAHGGDVVAVHEATLPPALAVMNLHSQNLYAETLFKLSGAALEGRGTWASGAHAVRAMLARRHIADGGSTEMRDGSGLSPRNHVSAGVLAQVLWAFEEDPLRGPVLRDSLPVSGRSGTLRRRLPSLRGRVHAKTGTLNDTRARALAGYLDGRRGHGGYVFAILLNGRGASHAVVDDLVREMAQ